MRMSEGGGCNPFVPLLEGVENLATIFAIAGVVDCEHLIFSLVDVVDSSTIYHIFVDVHFNFEEFGEVLGSFWGFDDG